jgi:hypothetical protein
MLQDESVFAADLIHARTLERRLRDRADDDPRARMALAAVRGYSSAEEPNARSALRRLGLAARLPTIRTLEFPDAASRFDGSPPKANPAGDAELAHILGLIRRATQIETVPPPAVAPSVARRPSSAERKEMIEADVEIVSRARTSTAAVPDVADDDIAFGVEEASVTIVRRNDDGFELPAMDPPTVPPDRRGETNTIRRLLKGLATRG